MKRGTPRHPKVCDLMRLAKVRRSTAVGWLELLWHATAEFAPQGDIGRCSDDWIEAQLDWSGKRGMLIDYLVKSCWLDVHLEWRLLVHDWHDHADDSVRKRLQRSGLQFLTHSAKVTGHCPDTDWKVSATQSDNVRLPEPSHSQSLSHSQRPKPAPVPAPPVGGPPLDTDESPAVREIRSMLVEFTNGRLGQPEDRICLKLLNFADGDLARVEDWLRTKLGKRAVMQSWGWFLQAGEAELRKTSPMPDVILKLAHVRTMPS